jgi:NADPH:quinone reductase-like Zn-dependent oxidoreductase
MLAASFDSFGDPAQVLQVRDLAMPVPQHGQVLVRMIASPINPSDLLMIRGDYGKRPKLPAQCGLEGVGVVEKSGGGLMGRRVLGRRVAVLNSRGGNWAEHAVIPAKQAVPVPDDLPDEQVACFFVNPATVIVMVEKVLRVPRGAWLIQTAAASALGKMIVRFCKQTGIRTLNVVRRPESAEELRRLGADAVVDTSRERLEERVSEIVDADGVRYGVDAVGGSLTGQVLDLMAPGGRLLNYGVLAGEPIRVPPRALIVGSKRLEGFWLADWAQRQNPLSMWRLFRRIASLLREGVLTTEVERTYPLSEVQAAARHAGQSGRTGKILLRMT